MHTKEQILDELRVMSDMNVLPKGLMVGIKDQQMYRPSKLTRMWVIGHLLSSRWPNFWLEVQERLAIKKALVENKCKFFGDESTGDLVEMAMISGVDFNLVDIS